MKTPEAVDLIEGAIPRRPGTWADLGAGDGTFTRALVELIGPQSRIYAVDLDPSALASIRRWARKASAGVVTVVGDFSGSLELPGLDHASLDGMLLANALHFVSDPVAVIAGLTTWLKPAGRVVLVEYDRRRASPWVPYPIPIERLPVLVAAGLSTPVVTATRPSRYGGTLYVAMADRSVRAGESGSGR